MPALTFQVGGDTSGLGRAMTRAKAMLGGLGAAAKKLAMGGLMLGAAGAASALVGLGVAARGVKQAFDLGGKFSDVAANTGLLAGEAMVMQKAFEDAGVSGEKLGPKINKMQKGIVEAGEGIGTAKGAFDALGLSIADLQGMSPGEQFAAIQEKIASLPDPAMRAARAMQIFGKSGGELGAVFADAGALSGAAESLGGQAEIMTKNAAEFDRASDLLGGMGAKLQGFFVGLASYITPVLLPVLEKLNKMDLSKYGAAAGRFIGVIVEGFKEGKITGMLQSGLIIAGKEFVNTLIAGVRGVVGFLAAALPPIASGMWAKMMDPVFWKGLGDIFKSLGDTLSAAILDGMGRTEDAKWRREAAKSNMEAGMTRIDMAGTGESVKDILAEGLGKGADAFSRSMEQGGPLDTSADRQALTDTWKGLAGVVDANTKAREEAAAAEARVDVPTVAAPAAPVSALTPIVSSLGKVGGATLIGRGRDTMDRERNNLLRSIDRKIGLQRGAVFA